MKTNRITTLFIAMLMVSSVGCSSSRFRNLLSRSEYQSLEELEAEGATGTDGESALVSQEREIDEDESKKPSRRSLFNLAAFIRGRDADEDLTSDPFVDSEVGEEEFDSAEEVFADNHVTPLDKDKARAIVEDAARSKDAAENLIREAKDQTENYSERSFLDEMTASADRSGQQEERPAPKNELNEQSFADFLAEQSSQATDDIEKTAQTASAEVGKLNERGSATSTVADEAGLGAFDQLLDKYAGAPADEISPSDLFPGLEELVPQQPQEVAATADSSAFSPFDDLLGQPTPKAQRSSDIGNESFHDSASQHGFSESSESDPWSAFRRKSATPAPQPAEDGFSWADNRSAPVEHNTSPFDSQALPAEPRSHIMQTAAAIDVQPPAPEFSATNITSPATEFAAAEFGSPAADTLVIPASPDPAAGESETAPPEFTDSLNESLFANAESIAAEEVTADDEQAPTETAAGFPISTRTLFLILGCVIVGFLLFMPERKNRFNA